MHEPILDPDRVRWSSRKEAVRLWVLGDLHNLAARLRGERDGPR